MSASHALWVTTARVSFAVRSNVVPRRVSVEERRAARPRIVPSRNSKSSIASRPKSRRGEGDLPSSVTRPSSPHSQSHGSIGSQSTWKSKSRPRSVTDQTNRPWARATQRQLISLFITSQSNPIKTEEGKVTRGRGMGNDCSATARWKRSGARVREREIRNSPRIHREMGKREREWSGCKGRPVHRVLASSC